MSLQSTILSGDWTLNGVTRQAHSLLEISTSVVKGDLLETPFLIDCSGIEEIDTSGLQLLYVWMQCLQIKGIQPSLTNISHDMQAKVRQVGFNKIFDSVVPAVCE